MIVTTSPFLEFAKELKPRFYHVTKCTCGRDLYKHAYLPADSDLSEIKDTWFHDHTESNYCKPQYANLQDDYNQDTKEAEPVYGPTNLELYWQHA